MNAYKVRFDYLFSQANMRERAVRANFIYYKSRLARSRQKSHENAAKIGTVSMISQYLENPKILQ